MPSIPIIMPQLGESIAEATIVNFLIRVGEQVRADQDIIEVETNKATMNVTAPCPGRVEKFLVNINESYAVGAVLTLYFLVFVGVAQLFAKVPALHVLAPTQAEPPFAIAEGAVLLLFVVLTVAAAIKFRPAAA